MRSQNVVTPLILAALASASPLFAAGKTYQVTGPVLEATPTKVVVQKGNETWEIARDPATKVEGDVKPGAKATIEYTMTAARITVKGAKSAAAPAGKATTRK